MNYDIMLKNWHIEELILCFFVTLHGIFGKNYNNNIF